MHHIQETSIEPMTFLALVESYLHGHLRRGALSSYKKYCQIYRQRFAGWSEHPTKSAIRQWHREHAATPAHTNKGLAFLKAMYNWAINDELWHGENPAAGIRRHATYDRERTLTNAELTLLMAASDKLFWKFRTLIYVLLTTGCRLGEACVMEWIHIDLEAGSWTKPKTKNGRSHRVPVPKQTCEAIRALPKTGRFVFMGLYDHALSRTAVEKMWGIIRRPEYLSGDRWPALRMPDVRLHDFRRTVASRLLDQGENILLIKAVLNHHQGDVTSIYARSSFDRQAQALQRHADGLWALTQEVYHETPTLSLPFPSADRLCAPESPRLSVG